MKQLGMTVSKDQRRKEEFTSRGNSICKNNERRKLLAAAETQEIVCVGPGYTQVAPVGLGI